MATVLFMLLGFILGAAIGFALPIGFAQFFAMAFEGGAQAGTAFAIMLPFTAIMGAIAGMILGFARGTTGSWCPPAKSDFLTWLMKPSLLDETTVQRLASDTDAKTKQLRLTEQAQILEMAYKQYEHFTCTRMMITQVVIFSILFPLFAPVGIALAIAYTLKKARLRRRIEFVKSLWIEQARRD